MPRLNQVQVGAAHSEEIRAAFDKVFGPVDPTATEPPTAKNGTPGTWWTTLANEPGIFHLTELRHQWQYSPDRSLSNVHKEIAILRTGWARGSRFVYSQHCKLLRNLGVPEQKVTDISFWSTSTSYSEDERQVLGYVDDLVLGGGRCPDARFEALREHLSDAAIIELTFLVCTYEMSAKMSLALRLEYDDVPDRMVEVGSGSLTSADVTANDAAGSAQS